MDSAGPRSGDKQSSSKMNRNDEYYEEENKRDIDSSSSQFDV